MGDCKIAFIGSSSVLYKLKYSLMSSNGLVEKEPVGVFHACFVVFVHVSNFL